MSTRKTKGEAAKKVKAKKRASKTPSPLSAPVAVSHDSGQAVRDYVQIAIDYATEAVEDTKRKKFGRLMRLAGKRFLDDLKRAEKKNPPFIFVPEAAEHACGFIECLPHVEGRWETRDIVLHPSHVFFVVNLFGFRKPKKGRVEIIEGAEEWMFHPRRFTSALFAVARKNAKSTLAAGILLYCECCELEEGAQVYSAATTFSQAGIIFNVAKRMVEKTSDLRESFGLEVFSKSVIRVETGSSFKPIHAKASTQDGLNPSHVGLDEIHAHKTPDLLNVLTSAAGARDNPLWLYTTTEGYASPGPWGEIRLFAKQLLEGVFKDTADHFLVSFYAVDEENKKEKIEADNEFDEAVWIKANPLIDINPHLMTAMRKEAIEAKAMPSKLAEFKIKRLNRPSSVSNGLIDLNAWQACGGEVNLEAMKKYPCWGALDLASTKDLTVMRLLWKVGEHYYTWARRWVPEDTVKQRTERQTVPYSAWVEAGYIEQTDGNMVDYAVIEDAVVDAHQKYNVKSFAYDRWNASYLVTRLVDKGVPLTEFIQGTKSYHPAMQEIERIYTKGNLSHGADPVLYWCASNLVARKDPNNNMAPDRNRSADKIDDMCALYMCAGISIGAAVKPEPEYKILILGGKKGNENAARV